MPPVRQNGTSVVNYNEICIVHSSQNFRKKLEVIKIFVMKLYLQMR